MQSKIINFFKKILYTGVKSDYQQEQINRIWLTNLIALISVLFSILYGYVYYKYNFYALVYVNFFGLMLYLSVIYINKFNLLLAQLMLFIVLVLNIFIASSFFGLNSQIHLLLFPTALLPFLLLDLNNRKQIFLYLLIVYTALTILYFTDFSLLYQQNLDKSFISYLDTANKLFSMMGSIIMLSLFVSIQNKSRNEFLVLKENLQNQLKSIFDNSFDAILLLDKKDGKIIRANRKAYDFFDIENQRELFNFSRKYLLNEQLTISDWASIIREIETKGIWESETQFISSKGKKFWGAVSIKNISIDEETALLIRITDITEKKEIELRLKENEEKYLGIFNSTPDGVFLLKIINGRFFVEDNNPIHQAFVEPIFSNFKGRYIDEILPPELSTFPISKYNECYVSGKILKYEEQILLPDGRSLWFFTILTPIKNEYGQVVRILGSSRDITSIKEAENNLKNALKEKEILLSEIHHRVKNNLAIVSGLLFLQSEKVKNPEDLYLFEESRNRINSMALIHETLYRNDDFTCIDFNKYLPDLINNISNSYKAKKNVHINISIDKVTLPIGIALPLGLLVNEILTNSFKHAFKNNDKPKLDILFSKDGNFYQLIIHDNGPGFDFESFKNAENSLGSILIFALAEQINATVAYNYENGAKLKIDFTF